jgi:alkylated DNA repair dioxygenase AlkB
MRVKSLLRWPRWWPSQDLLDAVRSVFTYGPGEDRATGNLYGDQPWSAALAESGPVLLDQLDALLNVRFTHVVFQAYRNGSGCDWHADTPFDAQAVLSLGATRTFGVRPNGGEPEWIQVGHGDLVYMPSGFQDEWEHCVPVENEPGERVSLVFRTAAKG